MMFGSTHAIVPSEHKIRIINYRMVSNRPFLTFPILTIIAHKGNQTAFINVWLDRDRVHNAREEYIPN
jgi:hypothetical protein